MSTAMTFKCPCCGGYLEFNPSLQKFKCLYCGQVLSEDDLREQSEVRQQSAEAAQAEMPVNSDGLRTYHCSQCGAEVVTDATTAATRCYFCHSPIVLHDRLDDEFRPDGVIPFKIDKEQARSQFMAYIRSRRFVDKAFFDSAQLEMFSGVYYPFWYTDVQGDVSFEGEGVRSSQMVTSREIVTTTRHFKVVRRGHADFRNYASKALTKVDGTLADGIHPFNLNDAEPYASGYLSGFLAEKRNVEHDSIRDGVVQELSERAGRLIRQKHTFDALRGTADFRPATMDKRYVLLPCWVLTWKADQNGAPYYYLMNGQTGRVCGKLPINKKKLWLTALGVGAGVFLALVMGGVFLW